MRTINITTAILLLIGVSLETRSQTLDQSQLMYEGAHSARNLPGSSTWQSFTAGLSGTLAQVDQAFASTMTGSATVKLYSGTGTSGSLLYTGGVTISGTTNFWQSFTISTPVALVAGEVYTWELIPIQGGGIPDPFAIQIAGPDDAYPGGQSSFGITWDYVFRTYVSTTVGIGATGTSSSSVEIYPNPFSQQTTLRSDQPLRNASFTLYNAQGQQVKKMDQISGETVILQRDNLPRGIYFLHLGENNATRPLGKLVVADQ